MGYFERLKDKKYNKKESKYNFKVGEVEGKISLTVEGIADNKEFEWFIELDDKKVKSVTIGPVLILSKKNSELFREAKVIKVNKKVIEYVAPINTESISGDCK